MSSPEDPEVPSVETPSQVLLAALDHSWKWVDARTSHRIQSVNFYLITTAFLAAGLFATQNARFTIGSAAISVVGALVSIGFSLADYRFKKFVRVGERALSEIQEVIAEATGLQHFRMMHAVERSKMRIQASRLIPIYLAAAALGWTVALIYSLARS